MSFSLSFYNKVLTSPPPSSSLSKSPLHSQTVRPLPERTAELLRLDLEAEVGIVALEVAALPAVRREHEKRPPAAAPPAVRARAALYGRRAADAKHVRQGEAQQRVLPGSLVVSFFFSLSFFPRFFLRFFFRQGKQRERQRRSCFFSSSFVCFP